MKTIFHPDTESELIERLNTLTSDSHARWGKMTANQMLTHCRLWDEMMQEKLQVKRMFAGRIFGRMALKSVLKDETPLARNTPSAPELIVHQPSNDLETLKQTSIKSIRALAKLETPLIFHPFFGNMTREQVGRMAYKHHDHHLRQFGV